MGNDISLLRLPTVRTRTGLSRSGVYAAVERGELAPPVKISKRASAWRSDAVDDFIRRKLVAAEQWQEPEKEPERDAGTQL